MLALKVMYYKSILFLGYGHTFSAFLLIIKSFFLFPSLLETVHNKKGRWKTIRLEYVMYSIGQLLVLPASFITPST